MCHAMMKSIVPVSLFKLRIQDYLLSNLHQGDYNDCSLDGTTNLRGVAFQDETQRFK